MTLTLGKKNKNNIYAPREIRFENQDAEYYTMGWLAFCRYLGRTAMLSTTITNDKPLRTLASRMSGNAINGFEDFVKYIVLNEDEDPEKNALKHIMAQLSIQYYQSNINHRFRGTPTDYGDWARTPKLRINQKMLDAIWLDNSNQAEARLAYNQHNLSRHEANINFLVDYYLKNTNFSLTQDNLYEELNRVHKDLEYYIGYEDPEPSRGKYAWYQIPTALPTEL
jgi:hypothetical protein